ncbi:unnamed protein product [Sphenostylis stenocarpa]|uniref:Uncharacterized protein n=1 Tax=Sphenostylis stenocarpa TaxID=92480 RepID=A0AA86VYV2_9FABA|nr:unnamed protein product [Sphenostylis stenocarpa]
MTLLTLSASVPGMKPTCDSQDNCHATKGQSALVGSSLVFHHLCGYKLILFICQLKSYHFSPLGILHPITVFYELSFGETEMKQVEVRRSLHSRLGLPYGRPLPRNSNALDFSKLKRNDMVSLRKGSTLLRDVHIGIPSSGVAGGNVSLIFKVPMNTSIIFTKIFEILITGQRLTLLSYLKTGSCEGKEENSASSKYVLCGRGCDGGDRFVGSVSEANDVPMCCRDGSGGWMCHLQPHKTKAFLDSP